MNGPGDTPKNKCLKCGYVADYASMMRDDDAKPKPGDLALCMKCGELYLFDKALKYRVPTHRELLELKASIKWLEVMNLRRALQKVRQTHPWPSE